MKYFARISKSGAFTAKSNLYSSKEELAKQLVEFLSAHVGTSYEVCIEQDDSKGLGF